MKKYLILGSSLLALAASGYILWDLHRRYQGFGATQMVLIEPGTRAPAIARQLVGRGVLAHRWPFLLRYLLSRTHHHLKAGEYLFDRALSPLEVYSKLVQGDVYLHPVTIPEGSDRFDMSRILAQQLGISADEFLRLTQQADLVRDLDSKAPTLEGYLFPDTYRFPRGTPARAAISAMVSRFRRVVATTFGAELQQSRRSLHDVVTLASLIEKETPDPGERPLVAEVFSRRLQKDWLLQCDPTVIYTGRLNHLLIGPPAHPITRSDLRMDSPYNTYTHRGLPPGPICNPGEASLRAALRPAVGDLFYFVSNNHGGHLFARTLAEHQRNVARYRREVAALGRGTAEVSRHVE